MGGTTAKAALVQNGAPRGDQGLRGRRPRLAAAAAVSAAAAIPIRTPVVDLVEIGAGGGSIAWVDSGGMLRVGPHSAGADPGPASYGKGGREPTVTDANLVLGRLNPDYFLGGEIELDAEQARRAVHERCARPLGMDVHEAALAVVEIANAAMVNALRLVSVQRGYDPRDFVLVAFGGAGPVHANRLAAETEIATTLIPPSPGLFSALGLLVSDLKHDYSTPLMRRSDRLDLAGVDAAFTRLTAEGGTALAREGVRPSDMEFQHAADLRYAGQSFELTISLPAGPATSATVLRRLDDFHREHERAYGCSAPAEPVEWVNLRLTALRRRVLPLHQRAERRLRHH